MLKAIKHSAPLVAARVADFEREQKFAFFLVYKKTYGKARPWGKDVCPKRLPQSQMCEC